MNWTFENNREYGVDIRLSGSGPKLFQIYFESFEIEGNSTPRSNITIPIHIAQATLKVLPMHLISNFYLLRPKRSSATIVLMPMDTAYSQVIETLIPSDMPA